MSAGWLWIEDGQGARREALRRGLTRVGGRGAEIALAASGDAQLQIEVRPGAHPRLVLVGSGARPRIGGREVAEADLEGGTSIEWCGATITLETVASAGSAGPTASVADAVLEIDEIDPAEMAGWGVSQDPAGPRRAAGSRSPSRAAAADPVERPAPMGPEAPAEDLRAWRRVQAGLCVELGVAGKEVARVWQARVREGGFDADRCADEVLAAARTRLEPTKLLERCGRLQRDLLMSPLLRGARGAARSVRTATRGFFAMLLAQGMALLVYSLLVAIGLLLLRVQGYDLTGWLDAVLGLFGLAPEGSS